jgi:succinylglutamate desuccinylase
LFSIPTSAGRWGKTPFFSSLLGDDGFFIARDVRPFWLKLSAMLRRLGIGDLAGRLPGVRRLDGDPNTLIVDTHLARLFPLQVFHLLGYRKRRWSDGLLVVSRRRVDRNGHVH